MIRRLSAAVLLAQLRKLERIQQRLQSNKRLFKSLIGDLPGLAFRDLPDPQGDLATHLVVLFPTAEIARHISRDLGSRCLSDSGWHIYSQMEHLLQQRTASMKGPPFESDGSSVPPDRYWPDMLPQTDALVSRAMTIGIGVADANLGSSFGVTVLNGADEVHQRAEQFRTVAERYLAA